MGQSGHRRGEGVVRDGNELLLTALELSQLHLVIRKKRRVVKRKRSMQQWFTRVTGSCTCNTHHRKLSLPGCRASLLALVLVCKIPQPQCLVPVCKIPHPLFTTAL